MKNKDQNGDTPATQHDLATLGGHLSLRIDEVKEELSSRINNVQDGLSSRIDNVKEELSSRIDAVQEDVSSVKRTAEAILKVVESIEGRFQETRGDHEQIEKHEDRITDVEVQVRMLQK